MTAGAPLFGRDFVVVVQSGETDAVEVRPPLGLTFSVSRTLRREPNEATIELHNLAPATRNAILNVEQPRVTLRVGYVEADTFLIFSGDCDVHKARERTDVSIVLEGKDGGDAYRRVRIAQPFAANTRVDAVVRALVGDLGIGAGNLEEFASSLRLASGSQVVGDGFTANGHVRNVLDGIVRSSGLSWSIQAGALQLRANNEAPRREIQLLSPDTGLIGSPTIDDDGLVTAAAFLRPGTSPGDRVRLESRDYPGVYEVTEVTYVGDSTGADWDAQLTLRADQ